MVQFRQHSRKNKRFGEWLGSDVKLFEIDLFPCTLKNPWIKLSVFNMVDNINC